MPGADIGVSGEGEGELLQPGTEGGKGTGSGFLRVKHVFKDGSVLLKCTSQGLAVPLTCSPCRRLGSGHRRT